MRSVPVKVQLAYCDPSTGPETLAAKTSWGGILNPWLCDVGGVVLPLAKKERGTRRTKWGGRRNCTECSLRAWSIGGRLPLFSVAVQTVAVRRGCRGWRGGRTVCGTFWVAGGTLGGGWARWALMHPGAAARKPGRCLPSTPGLGYEPHLLRWS